MTASDTKVFLCYAREDYDSAKRLYDDLKKSDVIPWMDSEDLLPGQKWRVAIPKALKESRYVLALLSSHSLSKRGFVQKELKRAFDLLDELPSTDIFVIPIRLDDCEPTDERLQELQWVDLFRSYEEGVQRILKVVALKKNMEIPPSQDVSSESITTPLQRERVTPTQTWGRQNTEETSDTARQKILILAVNPKDTARLRLDKEVKIIREALRHFKDRHDFELKEVWAVTIQELQRELLEHRPAIVHFCGHAEKNGLFVENEHGLAVHVPPAALGNLFRICSETIGMVVLNACDSAAFAGEIQQHIPYVIAMGASIRDQTALAFVRGVYEAVAAGRSFDAAFELGKNAMDLQGLTQSDIPLLLAPELEPPKKSHANTHAAVPKTRTHFPPQQVDRGLTRQF